MEDLYKSEPVTITPQLVWDKIGTQQRGVVRGMPVLLFLIFFLLNFFTFVNDVSGPGDFDVIWWLGFLVNSC